MVGQADSRGTYAERRAEAIEREAIEMKRRNQLRIDKIVAEERRVLSLTPEEREAEEEVKKRKKDEERALMQFMATSPYVISNLHR